MAETEDNVIWEKLEHLRIQKTDELGNQKKYRDPEPPKLVLSIIGDSKNFVPKPWITTVFKQGLIETVKGAKGIYQLVYYNT